MIDKVILQGDPNLDKARPAGISEILTKSGDTYRLRVDFPRGHARNPMTDEEVIQKFRGMASVHMSQDRLERLVDTVFGMDQLEDIGDLMKLVVFS